MDKSIILQHKEEKRELLGRKYIVREKLALAKKFLNTNIIKVITGPRRAGKSVFSILLLKNKNFAYLNFDDENFLKITNYDEIVKAISEIYPEAKYVLFDEIQNLDKWELFVNKLQRRGYNLILTGSNAKLLSQELSTALTGRHISIELTPFSFKEFLMHKNFSLNTQKLKLPEVKGRLLSYLDEYLKKGGFPEIVVKDLEPEVYLETLFDSILFKDVVKRHKVRFSRKISDLAGYLISNFSSEFSFNKLKNILDFRSVHTLQNYLNYLQEAYLIFPLNRFSFKTKQQIKAPKKIYIIDNGFILAKSFQFSPNIGKLMENLVFVELLRRGCKPNRKLFYYQTKNKKEVDFVIKQGTKIRQLIQVCQDLSDEKTKKREVCGLVKASHELKCNNLLVITEDYEGKEIVKNKKIKFLPLWQWLLKR